MKYKGAGRALVVNNFQSHQAILLSDSVSINNTNPPAGIGLVVRMKLGEIISTSVVLYLSCSPDTVYMLRAESPLRSQEVQDHLALFNNLENKQRHVQHG